MKLEPGVPYFGTDLCAYQGNSRYKHFKHLANLVNHRRTGFVLEVGSWAGASLVAWDEAFNKNAHFVVVDSWVPYFDGDSILNPMHMHGIMTDAAKSGQIFKLFVHNVEACGMSGRITVKRGDSRFVLPNLSYEYLEKFDLVFIDGDHRYREVVNDILNAIPLVRLDGILCGDDLEAQLHELNHPNQHKGLVVDRVDYATNIDTRNGTIPGYHPGVTQAVGEVFGSVSCFDGLWAVRKTATGWESV